MCTAAVCDIVVETLTEMRREEMRSYAVEKMK